MLYLTSIPKRFFQLACKTPLSLENRGPFFAVRHVVLEPYHRLLPNIDQSIGTVSAKQCREYAGGTVSLITFKAHENTPKIQPAFDTQW